MSGRGARKLALAGALALLGSVSGCVPGLRSDPVAPSLPQAERTARIFGATCAHCHVGPGPAAPRVGHPQEWNARETKDFEQLLQHTIEGRGSMPPLGTCSFCTEDDLRRLIALMVAGSEIVVPEAGGDPEEAGR